MVLNSLKLFRTFTTNSQIQSKICIVGSGPAGFYAAEYLQRRLNPVDIDLFERLPVPFGLVRYGVAPDHFNIKKAMNSFARTATKPNIRFFGNITLGKDILLNDLRKAYHVIILAYGADENRFLGIPGEDSPKVIPARQIVNWYNGNPNAKQFNLDLSNVNDVLIIGQGNVGIDIARILLTPVDKLRNTDITEYALETLSKSKVKNVSLVGRRGPIQAAFTIKELRELLKLEQCHTIWQPSDFLNLEDALPVLTRPKKRILELMLNSIKEQSSTNAVKTFKPRFFLSPTFIKEENNKLSITFTLNKLEGNDILNQRAIPTDTKITEHTDLIITSIGYKSVQAENTIPFDLKKGTTENIHGKIGKGLYSCGWVSSGPSGVLLSTMNDAFRTADLILKDIDKDSLLQETKLGFDYISEILNKKNVQIVTWDNWLKIDDYEKMEGEKLGKPREKIVDVAKMLKVAAS